MSAPNTIRWYVKTSFDDPKLRSPQPCQRGVHCDYRRWNAASKQMEPAVCHFVHPGEEGTGRRFFPARQLKGTGAEGNIREQPACVRLTGAAQGFYQRCGKKIPWGTWCAQKGIPYTPLAQGAAWEPVTVERIGGVRAPQTPQKPKVERPPPMAPKRSSGGGGATLSMEEWAATASPEELEDYRRHCEEDTGPDCNYCDPRSGCDGDHGDQMRDGFIVRKPALKPAFTLGLGGPTCSPGCACIWGERKCSDRLADEWYERRDALLTYAKQTEAAAAEVSILNIPDADGRLWYDSRTPVGTLAQALIACGQLQEEWHPILRRLVEATSPEELAAELGPADIANIKECPHHYATHVVERAQRIKGAKSHAIEALRSAIASAATNEEHDRLQEELDELVSE